MPVTPLVLSLAGGKTAKLTPAAKGFPERVHLRIEGGGSPPYIAAHWAHGSPFARKQAARDANVSEAELAQLVVTAEPWLAAAMEDIAADASPDAYPAELDARPYGINQRLLTQKSAEGTPYPTIGTAEELVVLLKRRGMPSETVIEWPKDQLERLTILDLDFHDPSGTKPRLTEAELDQLGYDLSPSPWVWWRTHGGGLKAVYAPLAHASFTATELASGAAAQLLVTPMVVRCGGTVELITRTRHPMATHNGRACGPVHESGPSEEFACLQRFSAAGATEQEVNDLLEQNEMVIGQRLDHSMCVIDPGHVSKSPAPVIVTETGLYCHSCSGRGLGGGFTSWGNIRKKFGLSVTLGDVETAPVMDAVRHFVHFAHADYLLATLAPELPARFRPSLYSALLKKQHGGTDPRLSAAFHGFGFVRGAGTWLYADTLMPVGRQLNMADVSMLPSVQYLDGTGMPSVNVLAVSLHVNHGNIPGWTPIAAARFVPIYAQFNTPTTADRSVVCRPRLADAKRRVSYIPAEKRIPQLEALKRISEYFPGISHQYMTALLIAMGCAESGRGSVPILWATGATEAAKTTTCRIILEMFGERYQNLSVVPEDRLDQIFGESLDESRLMLFDDFAKDPEDYKRLHTFFIRLNRGGHTYHRLHRGRVDAPINSAVILTDWKTPPFFTNEKQFARRAHIVHLERIPHNWERLGRKVEGWWTRTPEMVAAAESFFSWIVDDFFPEGDEESFDVKMTRLGINQLAEEAGSVDEQRTILAEVARDLILAICRKPELSKMHDEKRLGRGFREVMWGETQEIGRLCTALVESLGSVPKNSENLNHVLEPFKLEFHLMFPLKARATIEIKDYGPRTYVRVVQEGGGSRNPTKLINEELFETWPPPPEGFPRKNALMDTMKEFSAEPPKNTEPTQDFSQFARPAAGEQAQVLVMPSLPQFTAMQQPQQYFRHG